MQMIWVQIIAAVLAALAIGMLVGWFVTRLRSGGTRSLKGRYTMAGAVSELAAGNRDAALDILTSIVAENTEELDAYMALGILYRKKGWYARAVDIHRRLLSRPLLDDALRYRATCQLANDFEAAGLMDRALNVLADAEAMKHAGPEIQAAITRIHESAGDWEAAREACSKLRDQPKYARRLAFLFALDGLQQIDQNNHRAGIKRLQQALKIDPDNPAALLNMAAHYARKGKLKPAVAHFEKLQELRPDLTGIIADTLEQATESDGGLKLQQYYADLLKTQAGKPRVAVRYAAYLNRCGQTAAAGELLQTIDLSKLSPEMLLRLMETAEQIGLNELAVTATRRILAQVVNRDRLVCHSCGATYTDLFWSCPKCREWGTLKVRTDFELFSEEGDE